MTTSYTITHCFDDTFKHSHLQTLPSTLFSPSHQTTSSSSSTVTPTRTNSLNVSLSSFVADPLRLHHKHLLLRSLLLLRYLAAKVFLYLQILRSRTPSNSATLNKSETPSVNNFFCYSNDHWHSFSISNAFVLSFELSYSNYQTPMSLKPPLELLVSFRFRFVFRCGKCSAFYFFTDNIKHY